MPRRVEERRGMADGAGLDLATLFTINALLKIGFAAQRRESAGQQQEDENACTSIVIPPEASDNGGAQSGRYARLGTVYP